MACCCERVTAEGTGAAQKERKMDGEAYRRDHGGSRQEYRCDDFFEGTGGTLCPLRGHIERGMTLAQTGAVVVGTD